MIEFIESKCNPILEIKLLLNDMIDNVYDNIINEYKENNIDDLILIDKRLDFFRDELKYTKYFDSYDELPKIENKIYIFQKETFKHLVGIISEINDNNFIIKKKNNKYVININEYYIFYKDNKTKEEEKNNQIRVFLENILNNKIKIKVKKKKKI